MDVCDGRVVLGSMVCALREYALDCINAKRFVIGAFSIASGRRPSKLTIKTRLANGRGVGVTVAVAVGRAGVALGVSLARTSSGVAVSMGAVPAWGVQDAKRMRTINDRAVLGLNTFQIVMHERSVLKFKISDGIFTNGLYFFNARDLNLGRKTNQSRKEFPHVQSNPF